jgi:hypothetical protein
MLHNISASNNKTFVPDAKYEFLCKTNLLVHMTKWMVTITKLLCFVEKLLPDLHPQFPVKSLEKGRM